MVKFPFLNTSIQQHSHWFAQIFFYILHDFEIWIGPYGPTGLTVNLSSFRFF